MKRLIPLALAAAFLGGVASHALAQGGASIVVNESSKAQQPDQSSSKKRSAAQRAQHAEQKELQITVRNLSNKLYQGCVTRYYFFATDVVSKEVVIVGTGEQKIDLAPSQATKIDTKPVTLTYTQAYQKKTKGGKVTTVAPEGQKYAGYGVQVWGGETLLGEKFDPMSLKGALGDAWMQVEPTKRDRHRKPQN